MKYKTNFPLGKKNNLFNFVFMRVNNQTNKIGMFCICHTINGFKLLYFILGLLRVFLKATLKSMEE